MAPPTFSIFDGFYFFFHEVAMLTSGFMPDKLQWPKKIFFSIFLMERYYYIPTQ